MTVRKPAGPRLSLSSWFPLACAILLELAACTSTVHLAPVEDRRPIPTRAVAPAPSASAAATELAPAKPLPAGSENGGKPGYYTVKAGDTLLRIALESGQNWRDLARWNSLDNPNVLEVGQVLRVVSPAANANGVLVRPVLPAGPGDSRPTDAPLAGGSAAGTVVVPTAPTASSASAPAGDADENLRWSWPSAGALLATFDGNSSMGLEIGGQAGDPVLAAADGRVVYAGAGLRGYGNLVIVKHNATYLSAYAHNQTLLVKEDEVVRRGQKIAEMGSSDADKVELHFEIRRQGKPIDPMRLLGPR